MKYRNKMIFVFNNNATSKSNNDLTFFSNFTFNDFESYEYNYFGILDNYGNKNSLLFKSFGYDKDTNLYNIGNTYYNPLIGLVLKNLNYSKEGVPNGRQFNIYAETFNNIIVSSIPTDSEGPNGGGGEGDLPICGDGNLDPGEQCDDGDTDNDDCCDNNCHWTGNCRPFKPSPTSKNCKWVVAQTSIIGVHIMICIPVEPQ